MVTVFRMVQIGGCFRCSGWGCSAVCGGEWEVAHGRMEAVMGKPRSRGPGTWEAGTRAGGCGALMPKGRREWAS